MPDFFVLVPRRFTDAEADALADRGAPTTAGGYVDPPVVSWIPGRSVLVDSDDADSAKAFVLAVVDLTPEEIAQVKVTGPYGAT